MAISVKTVADKVYNLLKGMGYKTDVFNKEGESVGDPAEAIRFFVEDPNLLVTLNVPSEEIKFSVSENTDETDTLRNQLSNLARSHLMSLDFRVFGKSLKPISDKINVEKEKEMESVKEASLGSSYGSIKTSYQPLDFVKLVVKHTKPVNEEVRGARSRNISKIFIQTNEERFLFPSKNLQGARAMARHIYNGGTMHDTVAESIIQMCKDMKTLREFVNYVNKKGLVTEENTTYISLAKEHIDTIKTTFKKLGGVKTYSKAVESLSDYDNIEIVNEVNLEDHFTETHFDDKVGNAHQTLSKLVNKQSAFESFIMKTIESETFEGAKGLIAEQPMEFVNPHSRLGYQVSQLSSTCKDQRLANYLGGIGNKLSDGGTLDPMEYRAVKASLLSAQQPQNVKVAEDLTESKTKEYENFIDSFVIFDK
jgi:hemerythrin-like domain-containing protein